MSKLPDLPSGIYEHYKGDRYQVLGYASDSTNKVPHNSLMVVYVSLRLVEADPPRTAMHVREASEFTQKVCDKRGCPWYGSEPMHKGGAPAACVDRHPERIVPRFKYLRPA